MSIKLTQNFRLFTLLQSGEVVSKETIKSTLGISENSVPVYIFELRDKFNADVESVREGRKVVAYKLKNKIKVPQHRSNNAQYEKPVTDTKPVQDGSVAILDSENEPQSISDREMADLRDQLAIDHDYSFGGHGDEY